MIIASRVVALVALWSAASCATGDGTDPGSPLILIGIDGFRYDYLDSIPTPALHRLARDGVRVPLVPVFPTKTFPNFYTLVTGLYPDQHGIVANDMYDPAIEHPFRLDDRDAVEDPRWWGGEPIWNTAQRQGLRTATFFWPGSEAPIGGMRPTFWKKFDFRIPHDERVNQILAWLDLPRAARPTFVAMYFSLVDRVGHQFGPFSAQVDSAVTEVDRAIGLLLAGLDARGIDANVVVVSDHGFAARSPDRVIVLDDYVDLDAVEVIAWSPVAQIRPRPGQEESVYHALVGKHPHLAVYRKREIPERFHFRDHPRIQPIVAIADEGWAIASRKLYERRPEAFTGATHGYDHELQSMRAILLARGPAFRAGVVAAPFQNVHLYTLLAHLLGVTPAPNAGSRDSTAALLSMSGRSAAGAGLAR